MPSVMEHNDRLRMLRTPALVTSCTEVSRAPGRRARSRAVLVRLAREIALPRGQHGVSPGNRLASIFHPSTARNASMHAPQGQHEPPRLLQRPNRCPRFGQVHICLDQRDVPLTFFRSCFVAAVACAFLSAVSCPPPAVPLYATVSFTNGELSPGTVATYTCDPGYELFGSATRSCSDQGRWVGGLPYCAVNVAYGKPTNQSSTVRGGDSKNANDGDLTTLHENRFCTETKLENAPWWQVDLLRPYQVRVVRILTRGCCGHQPLHDLEIRVSNQSSLQGSRLCAWYPGTLEDGSTKDFECAYPILGRYVYIHMVGGEGSLSLCEVMVFTTQEFSPDRCGNQVEPLELTTFIRKCYEFQGSRGGSFQDASSYCQASISPVRGGLLVHSVDDLTLPFISAELERRREKLKSKLVWMGAQRRTGIGPGKRGWFWVSGEPVREFLWADDQPNNYNGQQNCVVIDGGRKWRWNDVTCDLDYLPWICQYNPSNCGSPDREENSTTTGRDYRVGQEVAYECPTGSLLVGSASRKCATSGFWTGAAPSCKYLDCGAPDPVDNGRIVLLHGRTTYNATVEYVCDTNYTLVGQPRRICGPEGRWNGTKPSCLQSYCTMLSPVPSSSLDVQGRRYGDRAHYKCDIGHKLIGNDTRYCQLGGTWSGDEPTCKYIDCGEPRPLEDGDVYLVNGTVDLPERGPLLLRRQLHAERRGHEDLPRDRSLE
ncbi:hypothetical protein HPB50_010883 [Hyalomma asiaticum]|uniref:Uncharacterized protein n=1 Tax=Hyalomma asiaticum TaxID=266040 RepID=A0ACB7RJB4_HYAAI|nr:hypothetical protein HPB50_010883 [Hyalomma asiaticum]